MNEELMNMVTEDLNLQSSLPEYTEEQKRELEEKLKAFRREMRGSIRVPGQKKSRNKMVHLIPKKKKRK